MSHIIGRPNDGLLDVMLGHGADREQAIIAGSEQNQKEREDVGGRLQQDEPTEPEP